MIAAGIRAPNYPAVTFTAVGDSVVGRIIQAEDYQPEDSTTLGVRLTLETRPNDDTSRVVLWAEGKNLMRSIAKAFRAQGAEDVRIGDLLAVTMTDDADYRALYARDA